MIVLTLLLYMHKGRIWNEVLLFVLKQFIALKKTKHDFIFASIYISRRFDFFSLVYLSITKIDYL